MSINYIYLILFIYFYLQRATLAEKEVNTLKEQLSSNTTTPITSSTPKNPTLTNGIPPPLSSPISADDCSVHSLSSKSINNNKIDEINENKMDHSNSTPDQHNNNSRGSPNDLENQKDVSGGDLACNNNNGSTRTSLSNDCSTKDKEVSLFAFTFYDKDMKTFTNIYKKSY